MLIQSMKLLKKILYLLFISPIIVSPLYAQGMFSIQSPVVTVVYDEPLEFAANDVIDMYPGIKKELESALLWQVDFIPTVVLIGTQEKFLDMAGTSTYVAYAIPNKNIMVIDYSRMNMTPFTLRITLKHELTHLLLHRYITDVHLPKWLDEGVAQWISDGVAEIVPGRKGSVLQWATLTGRFLRLGSISRHFPNDRRDITLAYEQSKRVVEYIIAEYGVNGILNILQAMKNGNEADRAVTMSLMISIDDLEKAWQQKQRSPATLLAYMAANIYTMVFIFAALLTFILYLRAMIRKRRMMDQEDGDDDYLPPRIQ